MNDKVMNRNNLISSLLFLILGIVLLMKSDTVMNIIAWLIGGVLILYSVIEFIDYYKTSKKLDISTNVTGLTLGIVTIIIGIAIIIFPGIIDIVIRVGFGGWILFAGINKLILALTVKSVDQDGYKVFLLSSILMIIIGIFVIINLFEILGLFLIVYAICEIVDYIFYTSQDKDYSNVIHKDSKGKKKVNKKIIEKEAIDAKIEEVEKE